MRHLTYSNVVATLALFLAVGGVSYAAVSLAPNSVGSTQLRSGSVTGSKLGFPLGMSTGEDAGPFTLNGPTCSGPTPCPPSATAPLASTTLSLAKPSRVLVIGSGNFNLSTPGAAASVELGLEAGATRLPSGFQTIPSTNATAVSTERVVSLPAGRQTVTLTAKASSTGPAVSGFDLQVAAVVLPAVPSRGSSRVGEPAPVAVRGG